MSIFEDFNLPEPKAAPTAKKATTVVGGRQDTMVARRLNAGPYEWREMILFSPESRTIREVTVDVAHPSANGWDMADGGWADPRFIAPLECRNSIQATFDAAAEAQAAYIKVKEFQSSKALYLARRGRADFAQQLAVEKELGQ